MLPNHIKNMTLKDFQTYRLNAHNYACAHSPDVKPRAGFYIFCVIGSGATIVLEGEVTGAEHAAKVNETSVATIKVFILRPLLRLYHYCSYHIVVALKAKKSNETS